MRACLTPIWELVIPDQIVASEDLASRLRLGGNGISFGVVESTLRWLDGIPFLSIRRSDLTKFTRIECDGSVS